MSISDFLAGIEFLKKIRDHFAGPSITLSPQRDAYEWRTHGNKNFLPWRVYLYIKLYISNNSDHTVIIESLGGMIHLDAQQVMTFHPVDLYSEIGNQWKRIPLPIILEGHKTIPGFFRFDVSVNASTPEDFADGVKKLTTFKAQFHYQVANQEGKQRRNKMLEVNGNFEKYKQDLFSSWSNRPDLVTRVEDP